MPAQHGLGSDQEHVASPVPVEAADEEPEELVTSPDAWAAPGAERNLELLAEEQVLDHKTLTAADGGDEGGQDEPDKFEHRGRIVDRESRQIAVWTLPRTSVSWPVLAGLHHVYERAA
jgi:hypothetical protein